MSAGGELPVGKRSRHLALPPARRVRVHAHLETLDDVGRLTRAVATERAATGRATRYAVGTCLEGASVKDKRPEPRPDCEDAPSTARPPFDPVEFARESDARIRAAAEAPVSSLPTVRPPAGSADLFAGSSEKRAASASMPDVQEVATTSDARDALGSDSVPFMAMSRQELAWFDVGPEATKLLAHVDGVSSIETVCARANVTAGEGASLLLDLAERGVVSFR